MKKAYLKLAGRGLRGIISTAVQGRNVYIIIGLSVSVAFFVLSSNAMADSYSINFNSSVISTSGTDPRTPGNSNQWWDPSGVPTSAEVTNGGLYVYNNGNGQDKDVTNVMSPELAALAGQTGPSAQPGATENTFTSSYDLTLPSNAVDGFDFISNSEGQDRTTWLGFTSDSSGVLSVGSFSANNPGPVGATTTWPYTQPLSNLAWGDTYRVTTSVRFGSGLNPDVVNYSVLDLNDNSVAASWTDTTWADYFLYDGEQTPYGNIMTGADALMFEMRDSNPAVGDGVYINNLCYSTSNVPEPPTFLLLGLALIGLATLRMKFRTA